MKKRGQMIVIAALLMAILLVSLLPITYMATTHYRFMRYKSVKEITANIASEFQRGLEAILATSTHIYNKTFYLEPGRIVAKKLFNRWIMTLLKAYSGVGIQVNVSYGDILLQPAKDGYPEVRIEEGEIMKCFWYFPRAISAIYATMSLNLTEYGLYGWNISRLVLLNLTINTDQIGVDYSKDIAWFNITLLKEYQEPVNDLAEGILIVRYYDKNVNNWKIADIINITYRGAGDYTIFFKYPHDDDRYKYLEIMIVDTRGIMVEATTYSISTGIEFIITRNTPNITVTNETYTLEAVLGGKWYWNGHEIDINGEFPPIPPLPIKQFRVNVSENGQWKEIPVQYEVWKLINWHGHDIWVPVDLAIPFERVNSSMRIVFQVNFPPSVATRHVRIWWLYDVDAMPPQLPTDLEYMEGEYTAKTNVFNVEFIGVEHTFSDDYRDDNGVPVDYRGVAALIMKNQSGYCFGPLNLHGFDMISEDWWDIISDELAKWRPYGKWKIKFWYPGTNQTKRAIVRLIAFLNSTKVGCIYDGSIDDGYYDTLVIVLINANVKYLQIITHVYWTEDSTGNGLWFFMAMGRGYPKDYAYLDLDETKIREGSYEDLYGQGVGNAYHAHDSEGGFWDGCVADFNGRLDQPFSFLPNDPHYPGYWIAHWDDNYGRGFIIDENGLYWLYNNSASKYEKSIMGRCIEANPYAAFSKWTSIDDITRQRSVEYESRSLPFGDVQITFFNIWESHPDTTVPMGTYYNYTLVEWDYEGGGYTEISQYYYMFLKKYSPTITIISGP